MAASSTGRSLRTSSKKGEKSLGLPSWTSNTAWRTPNPSALYSTGEALDDRDWHAARFVGQSVRRKEDPRLLTGKGQYVGDVELPGMLHAAFVRSPYASAQIVSIDTAEARELPGVVDVFVAEDLSAVGQRDTVTGKGKAPFPPLAIDAVLFVGDPVALVIAETRAAAEDGAELVVVDYEPGTAVVTIDDALREGAPVVHPELEGNVHSDMSVGSPETDAVLASAPNVITETVAQQRYLACPMEREASSPAGNLIRLA